MGFAMASIQQIISDAADRYGVDRQTMLTIADIESGMNPQAQNPNSSAGGLYQFIDSTWDAYGGGNKYDPYRNADAAGRYLSDVKKSMTRALGREPTSAELYLGHQQGAAGAIRILANPNKKASSLVGNDAVRLNAGDANMTASAFAENWGRKYTSAEKAISRMSGQMQEDAPTPAPRITSRNTPYPQTRTTSRMDPVFADGPSWSQFQDFVQQDRPAPQQQSSRSPRMDPIGPGASLRDLQSFQLSGFGDVYDRMAPAAKTLRAAGRMDDIGTMPTFGQLGAFLKPVPKPVTAQAAQSAPQTLSSVAPLNPNDHNPQAFQAITEGQRSYTTSSGVRMPTRTISGAIRKTYGDR